MTDSKNPNFVRHLTDNRKSSVATSESEGEDPDRPKLRSKSTKPIVEAAKTKMFESICTELRDDTRKSREAKLEIETNTSNCTGSRAEVKDPRVKVSSEREEGSDHDRPSENTGLSGCPKACNRIGESISPKFNVGRSRSTQQELCSKALKPTCARSKANVLDSKVLPPKASNGQPMYSMLRSDDGDSDLDVSNTKGNDSIQTNDCRDSKNPNGTPGNTKKEKPNQLKPIIEPAGPKRP